MEPIQCYVLCILILIYLDFKRFFQCIFYLLLLKHLFLIFLYIKIFLGHSKPILKRKKIFSPSKNNIADID